jgi:hypothetical protein
MIALHVQQSATLFIACPIVNRNRERLGQERQAKARVTRVVLAYLLKTMRPYKAKITSLTCPIAEVVFKLPLPR